MESSSPHKFRLLLSMQLILTVAFVSVSLINYELSKRSIRKDLLTSDLPLTRDTIYSEIQRDLMPPIFVASSMANDTFLKDWAIEGESLDRITKYLDGIHEKYEFFSTFFVSSKSQLYYHFNGILKKVSPNDEHDVWYYNFINSGLEYDLDVDTNQATNDILTIFINFRVLDYKDELLGVTGVGLLMDKVSTLFRSYQAKYSRTLFLVDPQGLIQVHSDDATLVGKPLAEQPGLGKLAPEILANKDEPMDFAYMKNGRHHLLTARYLPEINWYLLVEQNEDLALSVARSNLWRTLFAGLAVSLIILLIMLMTINSYQKRLELLAVTDPLTGAANRRLLEEHFHKARARCERSQSPFSVMIIDLDGFKSVNDTLGHVEGDRVLRLVADILGKTVRKEDLLARWGGDEFVVLVEGDAEQARALAERMRALVEESKVAGEQLPVTVSIGVAEYRSGESMTSLTSRADHALFQAKEIGRNQVTTG